MMPDLPNVLLTALKLALALSVVSIGAFLCWLAWCLRAIMLQDAQDRQMGLDALDDLAIPSDATVEVCGEVFSAEEARWLAALQRIWHNEPVEVR